MQLFLVRRHNVKVPREAILATAGVSGAIVSTLLYLRGQGRSRVALLEPFYTYHQKQVEAVFSSMPAIVPCRPDFGPDWAQLDAAFARGLDAIILTNPNNPSGRVWRQEELDRLVELVERHQAILIVDEIYCDMIWRGEHGSPLYHARDGRELSRNVVVCRGWAKSLAAQSWRVGFLVAHPSLTQAVLAAHDPVYIAVSWTQYALARYLTEEYADYKEHVARTGQIMQRNWEILSHALHEALGWEPVQPEGSMYGMFRHSETTDLDALVHGLDLGIGVAPGSMFYGNNPACSGFIRIHYGFSTETAETIAQSILERARSQQQKKK